MIPLTNTTSYELVMPVGTHLVAVVFVTGHMEAARMAKVGLPLDVIGIARVIY